MRDRVVFQRREAVLDGYGNTVGAWQDQFTRFAEIRPAKGGEGVTGQRLRGHQPSLVIVRYDNATSGVTPAWRLIDGRSGTIYSILTASDMERNGAFWTMLCETGGRR